MFSATVKKVVELHLLVDHLDAQAVGGRVLSESKRRLASSTCPRSRPHVAADHHAEGRLARPVLTDDGVDGRRDEAQG